MILGDRDIRSYLEKGLIKIEPLSEDTIRENGVDLRIGNEIARFKKGGVFDPDKDNISNFIEKEIADEFIINPHEHVLLTTKEYVKLPSDVIAFVNLRSTFARLGLFIPPTIVDAGFEGELTIELVGSELPMKLKHGMRFIHLIFAKTLTPVERPYTGKYQNQRGVTISKLIS